jgi:hypothetical protein
MADNSKHASEAPNTGCSSVRSEFSAYLDGALTGVEMAALSAHFATCAQCASDFKAWRAIQQCLSDLGPAQMPSALQMRLRQTIAAERERGSYLPPHQRALRRWRSSIAPTALRLSGGLAAALVLAGGLSWMFGAPIDVQANDDAMAHLVAPRYLYSQVPPEPIKVDRDAPIVVEAMVDSKGRVYDFSILNGPRNPQVLARLEDNLMASVFRPATAFGVPIKGHVVLTYMGVLVRG